jgi:hypothetical protein
MSGIVLSASVRQNLLSLQSTADLLATNVVPIFTVQIHQAMCMGPQRTSRDGNGEWVCLEWPEL